MIAQLPFAWLGLALIVLSFILLNTRYSHLFLWFDGTGSLLMGIAAAIIGSIPFMLINFFIMIMCGLKLCKEGEWNV